MRRPYSASPRRRFVAARPSSSTAAAFEKYLSDPITSRKGRPRPRSSYGHEEIPALAVPQRPLTARQPKSRGQRKPWSPQKVPATDCLDDVSSIPAIPVQKLLKESHKYCARLPRPESNPLAGTREDPSSFENMLAELRTEYGAQLGRQGLQAPPKTSRASLKPTAYPAVPPVAHVVVPPEAKPRFSISPQQHLASRQPSEELEEPEQAQSEKTPVPLPHMLTKTEKRLSVRMENLLDQRRGALTESENIDSRNIKMGVMKQKVKPPGLSFASYLKSRAEEKRKEAAKAQTDAEEDLPPSTSRLPSAETTAGSQQAGLPKDLVVEKTLLLFQRCVKLSKRFDTPMPEAKRIYDEFKALDSDESGYLDREEFQAALRQRCHLGDDDPIPESLELVWKEADVDGSGQIEFEEYFEWAVMTKWKEELLVTDKSDQENRMLARKFELPLLDVERYRKEFNIYDTSGDGEIDQEEFIEILMKLMRIKDKSDVPKQRLDRFWREIDEDGSGSVTFDEFVSWCKYSGPASLG
mmetsp:Transcript_15376/g.26916  ORF Transcript_15376/g.26916 Transcript_15376/m.26916 type:complete len:525 (+) Transcript_15376:73-1647(+)